MPVIAISGNNPSTLGTWNLRHARTGSAVVREVHVRSPLTRSTRRLTASIGPRKR